MENIGFETLAQSIGVPAAVGVWIWWQSRGRERPPDIGEELVRKVDDMRQRLTRLEVVVEERTKK